MRLCAKPLQPAFKPNGKDRVFGMALGKRGSVSREQARDNRNIMTDEGTTNGTMLGKDVERATNTRHRSEGGLRTVMVVRRARRAPNIIVTAMRNEKIYHRSITAPANMSEILTNDLAGSPVHVQMQFS